MKRLICILLSFSMAFESLAAVQVSENAGANKTLEEVKTLHTQFDKPASALSLFVYSIFLDQYIKNLESESKLSKWLMARTRSVEDRKIALGQFIQYWTDSLKANLALKSNHADLDSYTVLERYFADSSVSHENRMFVHSTLKTSLGTGFSSLRKVLQDLELSLNSSTERVQKVLDFAALMAPRDSQFLEGAATLGVIFSYSSEPAVSSRAIRLLNQVARKMNTDSKFDPTAPQNLLGAGGIFRGILVPAFTKVKLIRSALAYIGALPTATIATVGSVSLHGAVLLALSPDESSKLSEIVKIQKEIRTRNEKDLQATSQKTNLGTTQVLISDSERMLMEKATRLLKLDPRNVMGWEWAELFASGEYEYNFFVERGQSAGALDMTILKKSIFEKKLTPLAVKAIFEKKAKAFEEYMAKRKIKVLDGAAMVQLRVMVSDLVGIYEEKQDFSFPLFSLDQTVSNCVARVLVHTAFFYPLFMKYKPRDLEFGIQAGLNHIQAVLINKKSDVILAIQSMDKYEEADFSNDDETIDSPLTIYSPKIFAGAYLLNRFGQLRFEFDDLVIEKDVKQTKLAKDHFLRYVKTSCKNDFCSRPVDSKLKYFNNNPFVHTDIRDPVYFGSIPGEEGSRKGQDGKAKSKSKDAKNKGSAEDKAKDQKKGPEQKPSDSKEGKKTGALDPEVLKEIQEILNLGLETVSSSQELTEDVLKANYGLSKDGTKDGRSLIKYAERGKGQSPEGDPDKEETGPVPQARIQLQAAKGNPSAQVAEAGQPAQPAPAAQQALAATSVKPTQNSQPKATISPTALYAAQKRVEDFIKGGAVELKTPEAKDDETCVELEEYISVCAEKIDEYLSFPVVSSKMGFNVLTDNKSLSELPFTDLKGFADFFKGTAVNFMESPVFKNAVASLKANRTTRQANVDGLISMMNLFSLYVNIMDTDGIYKDENPYVKVKAELQRNGLVEKMQYEIANFKTAFASMLTDKSGTEIKKFFEAQVAQDAQETLKQNIAFQTWFMVATGAERNQLRSIMDRAELVIQKMDAAKVQNKSKEQETTKDSKGNSQKFIIWSFDTKSKDPAVITEKAKPQQQSTAVAKDDKIYIHMDSLSGFLLISTLGGVLKEDMQTNIGKLKLEDIMISAKGIGSHLASMQIWQSAIYRWFSFWSDTAMNCEKEDQAPICNTARSLTDSLYSRSAKN